MDTSFFQGYETGVKARFFVASSGLFRTIERDFICNSSVRFWADFGAKTMFNYLGFVS